MDELYRFIQFYLVTYQYNPINRVPIQDQDQDKEEEDIKQHSVDVVSFPLRQIYHDGPDGRQPQTWRNKALRYVKKAALMTGVGMIGLLGTGALFHYMFSRRPYRRPLYY